MLFICIIITISDRSSITFMLAALCLIWMRTEKREKQSLTLTESHFLPTRMESKVDEYNRSSNAFCKVTVAMALYSAFTAFPFLTFKYSKFTIDKDP